MCFVINEEADKKFKETFNAPRIFYKAVRKDGIRLESIYNHYYYNTGFNYPTLNRVQERLTDFDEIPIIDGGVIHVSLTVEEAEKHIGSSKEFCVVEVIGFPEDFVAVNEKEAVFKRIYINSTLKEEEMLWHAEDWRKSEDE